MKGSVALGLREASASLSFTSESAPLTMVVLSELSHKYVAPVPMAATAMIPMAMPIGQRLIACLRRSRCTRIRGAGSTIPREVPRAALVPAFGAALRRALLRFGSRSMLSAHHVRTTFDITAISYQPHAAAG